MHCGIRAAACTAPTAHRSNGGLIDSFSIAHLAVFIEREFAVYIADVDLTVENMDTLRQIGELIRKTNEGTGATATNATPSEGG